MKPLNSVMFYGDGHSKVLPPFTHLGGNMAEIFKPLGVSLGESIESML